jgi:outer membrane receptor protein involved in Fe transport
MHFHSTPCFLRSLAGLLMVAFAFLYPADSEAQSEAADDSRRKPAIVPEEAPTLDEVVVTAASEEEGTGYTARESGTAMKTRTLLLETPQAVSIVTRNIANQRPLKSYSHFGPGGAVNNVGFEELANVLFMTIFRIWRPGTG